jgi:hypothetical protein
VGLGFLIGLFLLAGIGAGGVPRSDNSEGWYLRWFGYVGSVLTALVFVLGSLCALRNQRIAAWIFLFSMPVCAFCLSYPFAGYLVWHADGGGWFETPHPIMAISLALLFYAPILVLVLAIRYKKPAFRVFLISAGLVAIPLCLSHWSKALLPLLAEWSLPYAVPGLIWLGIYTRGWQPLRPPRPRTVGQRLLDLALNGLVLLCVSDAAVMGLFAMVSTLHHFDCNTRKAFDHPLYPSHAVFTARIVLAGRSLDALIERRGVLWRDADRREGDWAIGVVQERFWGLPRWMPRLVLLTNCIFWQGETYFVDGTVVMRPLVRLLPIVSAGPCTRTSPVEWAVADLRLLRQPRSASGTRIIGFVKQPKAFAYGLSALSPPKAVAGAQIRLIGPTGTRLIFTDAAGVYQLDDLPAGDYTLQVLVPDNQLVGYWSEEHLPESVHLDNPELVEQNFDIFWDGRIEGRVVDESGKPAHAWVEINSVDGKRLPGNVRSFLDTKADGSYHIHKIPAGRYIAMLNPNGPSNDSPYDPQYYPSTLRAAEAKVLQLADGQKIDGVDFTVHPLAKRSVQVHVAWPDGKPVTDAAVIVVYQYPGGDPPLKEAGTFVNTDPEGNAVIQLHGNTQVKLRAEHYVFRPDRPPSNPDTYVSQTVESEITALPDKINLVMTSPAP